jgi:hypothetical protein
MLLALLLGGAGVTESIGQGRVVERPGPAGSRQEGIVRVQMAISLFVAGPTDESEAANQQRERARRVLYQLASKECDLLREVIARDCRLDAINVNLNRQQRGPQVEGYQAMGNMTYQITLK